MSRKRLTNERITFGLLEAENGATIDEVCRKMGVSEPTFYLRKKQFVGKGVSERHHYNEDRAHTAVGGLRHRGFSNQAVTA